MNFPFIAAELPNLQLLRRGATKDVFGLDGDRLLLVCTDRVRTPDADGQAAVAGRGCVIQSLSTYWFDKLGQVFPNHLVSPCRDDDLPAGCRNYAQFLDGRAMVVHRAHPLPFTCIVCGYLVEDVWEEYRREGTALGFEMPVGMSESQRLPAPLFGAAMKPLPGRYGELLDFTDLTDVLGGKLAAEMRDASLRLFLKAWKMARGKGVLIAENLFSFGLRGEKLILIDECLTTDSSRFWPLEDYCPGRFQTPLDHAALHVPKKSGAALPYVSEVVQRLRG